MATNSSEHLGLHLWEPTDQVLRTEFNQNWAKLDEAVNTAQETAEAAQDAADEKPYVIGSYTGNGPDQYDSTGHLIELGFQPSFVIITRGWLSNGGPGSTFLAIGQPRADNQDRVFELAANGFIVKNYSGGILELNQNGTVYDYIAFQ